MSICESQIAAEIDACDREGRIISHAAARAFATLLRPSTGPALANFSDAGAITADARGELDELASQSLPPASREALEALRIYLARYGERAAFQGWETLAFTPRCRRR